MCVCVCGYRNEHCMVTVILTIQAIFRLYIFPLHFVWLYIHVSKMSMNLDLTNRSVWSDKDKSEAHNIEHTSLYNKNFSLFIKISKKNLQLHRRIFIYFSHSNNISDFIIQDYITRWISACNIFILKIFTITWYENLLCNWRFVHHIVKYITAVIYNLIFIIYISSTIFITSKDIAKLLRDGKTTLFKAFAISTDQRKKEKWKH